MAYSAALAQREQVFLDFSRRTAEQLETGLFYIEPSLTSMNRLARQLVAQEPVETKRAAASKQLLAHAPLFAALNISIPGSTIGLPWCAATRSVSQSPIG